MNLISRALLSAITPRCALPELGGVALGIVREATDVALFSEPVDRYHGLGHRQPVGCHLRYFIVDGQGRRLGCLLFQRASARLRDREAWIGWSDRRRQRGLERVVCNARFLVLPWVRVPNLASHVLALAAARLADDWQARWKVRPLLVETFMDGATHSGTVYRAAGWERIGQSAGRRDRGTGPKALWVRALQADARAVPVGERRTRRRRQAAVGAVTPRFVELWRDCVGIIAETAAEHDAQWRVRRRTVGTLLVMRFVFRLAFPHNREGHAVTVGALWDHCRMLGVELPQEHPVAASTVCTARRKVGDAVFREVHHRIIGRMDDGDVPRWCGRRLYAVDGTKVNLPREPVERGYPLPQPGAHYPQGLLSCLYRLNDRMPVDFDLAAHGDERRMAAAHLPHVRSGDVVVYDRGYYSFGLLDAHVRRGVDCVFRLPRSSARAFGRLAESGEAERLVQVLPGRGAGRRWQRAHPGETPLPVTVRCVRIATAGGDFLLATTLTDGNRFPLSALGEAYHGRRGIEELCRVSKGPVAVEQFHARTEGGVRREPSAHFTMVALARSLGNPVEDAIGGCIRDGAPVQVNFRHALASVARRLEALVLGQVQAVGETVARLLQDPGECVGRARPGRSHERVSRRPDERFRNRKGKSAGNTPATTTRVA